MMKRFALAIALGWALSGCVSTQESSAYVGRPIAEAVRELGLPYRVADYPGKGRYFGWTFSDVLLDDGAANPANWLDPTTRENAPENLAEEKLISLPDHIVRPAFRPEPCSLTLVAEWDVRADSWIARKVIRRGHCGMRSGR